MYETRGARFWARALGVLATVGLVAGGCGRTETVSVTGQPAPALSRGGGMAGLLQTVNNGEVSEGRLALGKTSNASVRQFAQRMVDDHTHAMQQTTELITREGLTLETPMIATDLERIGQQASANLRTYTGAAFDRVYMQRQVAMHEWVLTVLDNSLIPAARDRDVEAHLRMVRSSVAAHLTEARRVLTTLPS